MKQLIILIAVLVCCDSALACSCIESTTTERYSRASHVFRAHVESVDLVPMLEHLEDVGWRLPDASNPESRVVQARFELLETYKGSPQLLHSVYTHPHGSTCGLGIVDDSEYVFFADPEGIVGHCDGSKPVWYGNKDLIESLKLLASQQSDPEKNTGPEDPESHHQE